MDTHTLPMTNIDDESTDMFDAVRNARNIALMSCFVNGEPATAIVCINEQNDGNLNVQPLYVSITPSMVLTWYADNEKMLLPDGENSEPVSIVPLINPATY